MNSLDIPTAPKGVAGDIDSINHIGLAVEDIDLASAAWQKLGFNLTPLSMHFGSPGPGADSEPLGTGNRCAVFENNYFELLAYIDTTLPDLGVQDSLARFEGAHYLCFGCESPSVVNSRLIALGLPTSGVMPLQRDVDTEAGVRTARFERVVFDDGEKSEGEVQAAYHYTPELIHQSRYVRHDNGTRAIKEVVIVADDPESRAREHAHFTGGKVEELDFGWAVPLPTGRIAVYHPDQLTRATGVLSAPGAPAIAAVRLGSDDLESAEQLWAARGIPVTEFGAQRVIQRDQASGLALIFEQE